VNLRDELLLNQIAQGVRLAREGEEWFAALPGDRRQEVLRWLANMATHAGARAGDAEAAIRDSGLRPTATPCVLLSKDNLPVQLAKIVHLPAGEQPKAFRLLVALFRIADARRRAIQCAGGCSHWWHRDLSDGGVVEELLSTDLANI
jgi:hypothetical protein